MLFTKFALVSAWMVELFNFVVGVRAIEILTPSIESFFALDMAIIFEIGSAAINGVVIEETEVSVVFFYIWKKGTLFFAWKGFESI